MGGDHPILTRLEQGGTDLLFGLGQWRINPGFTAVAVLTLALGIGVNTAMFGVVRSLLSRAAAFPDPDRLVLIDAFAGPVPARVTEADYLNLTSQRAGFGRMAAFDNVGRTLTGAGEPLTVRAVRCTADFAPTLGLHPVLGRLPEREEYAAGAERVAAITDRLWAREFARDSAVLGRIVKIDGVAHTIVGVLPLSAALETLAYTAFDVLVPIRFEEQTAPGASASLRVVARLADGATVEPQSAAMAAIPAGHAPLDREASAPKAFRLRPLEEFLVPVGMRVMTAGLLAAVAVVLLVACLNLASISAARTAARRQELAIRAALGASAGRILRQLAAENLLVALSGGLMGIVAGIWALRVLGLVADAPLYITEALRIDATLLGHGFLLCLLATLAFGVLPAAVTARSVAGAGLRSHAGGAGSGRVDSRLRSGLVVAELAVGVPLLVAMSLVVRHLDTLASADVGFPSDGIVTARIDLPAFRYGSDAPRATFVRDAMERIRAVPAVASVGAASSFPVGAAGVRLAALASVEGSRAAASDRPEPLGYQVVTPGYIETLGVRLLRGRQLSDSDTAASDRVAVANQRLADLYWPDGDGLGRTIVLDPRTKAERTVIVVGVVADFGQASQGGPPEAHLYLPYEQEPVSTFVVVVRAKGAVGDAARQLRDVIRGIDDNVPVGEMLTAAEVSRLWLRDDQVGAILLSILGGLALALTTVGLYGLMAHLVARQTCEIGVRMAFGASRAAIRWMVIRRAARLAAVGLAIGGLVAVPLGFALAASLYGASGFDPAPCGIVAALLFAVAAMAAYVPARRASRVEPMVALRRE